MQSASAAELNVYVNAGPILIDINFLDPAKPLEANDIDEAKARLPESLHEHLRSAFELRIVTRAWASILSGSGEYCSVHLALSGTREWLRR